MTLSKETLEEIAELARKATYKPCAMHITNLVARCDSEVVEELIRELLERRERDKQEPVAIVDIQSGRSDGNKLAIVFTRAAHALPDDVYNLYAEPPAPVAQPVQVPECFQRLLYHADGMRMGHDWNKGTMAGHHREALCKAVEDCRAAMLQGKTEPVSQPDELSMDYLQGHKDGLEWASRLAEANHPQTGDWLYDDPLELAKAIRKGPDMPELKSVPADDGDSFYSWFGRFWSENYQQNNYTTSAKQMLVTMAEFAFRAGRESATQVGNSPVTPDGWVILPAEPTHAMMNAWLSEVANWRGHAAGYRAMIAAAPKQESE